MRMRQKVKAIKLCIRSGRYTFMDRLFMINKYLLHIAEERHLIIRRVPAPPPNSHIIRQGRGWRSAKKAR